MCYNYNVAMPRDFLGTEDTKFCSQLRYEGWSRNNRINPVKFLLLMVFAWNLYHIVLWSNGMRWQYGYYFSNMFFRFIRYYRNILTCRRGWCNLFSNLVLYKFFSVSLRRHITATIGFNITPLTLSTKFQRN